MRVLLLENDQTTREIVADTMRAAGYVVDDTGSGAEAFQQLRATQWDVLIADLVLPGISGFDVLSKCQTEGCLPTKVVVTTALGPRDTADLPAGVHLLRKPYTLDELLALLQTGR